MTNWASLQERKVVLTFKNQCNSSHDRVKEKNHIMISKGAEKSIWTKSNTHL